MNYQPDLYSGSRERVTTSMLETGDPSTKFDVQRAMMLNDQSSKILCIQLSIKQHLDIMNTIFEACVPGILSISSLPSFEDKLFIEVNNNINLKNIIPGIWIDENVKINKEIFFTSIIRSRIHKGSIIRVLFPKMNKTLAQVVSIRGTDILVKLWPKIDYNNLFTQDSQSCHIQEAPFDFDRIRRICPAEIRPADISISLTNPLKTRKGFTWRGRDFIGDFEIIQVKQKDCIIWEPIKPRDALYFDLPPKVTFVSSLDRHKGDKVVPIPNIPKNIFIKKEEPPDFTKKVEDHKYDLEDSLQALVGGLSKIAPSQSQDMNVDRNKTPNFDTPPIELLAGLGFSQSEKYIKTDYKSKPPPAPQFNEKVPEPKHQADQRTMLMRPIEVESNLDPPRFISKKSLDPRVEEIIERNRKKREEAEKARKAAREAAAKQKQEKELLERRRKKAEADALAEAMKMADKMAARDRQPPKRGEDSFSPGAPSIPTPHSSSRSPPSISSQSILPTPPSVPSPPSNPPARAARSFREGQVVIATVSAKHSVQCRVLSEENGIARIQTMPKIFKVQASKLQYSTADQVLKDPSSELRISKVATLDLPPRPLPVQSVVVVPLCRAFDVVGFPPDFHPSFVLSASGGEVTVINERNQVSTAKCVKEMIVKPPGYNTLDSRRHRIVPGDIITSDGVTGKVRSSYRKLVLAEVSQGSFKVVLAASSKVLQPTEPSQPQSPQPPQPQAAPQNDPRIPPPFWFVAGAVVKAAGNGRIAVIKSTVGRMAQIEQSDPSSGQLQSFTATVEQLEATLPMTRGRAIFESNGRIRIGTVDSIVGDAAIITSEGTRFTLPLNGLCATQ